MQKRPLYLLMVFIVFFLLIARWKISSNRSKDVQSQVNTDKLTTTSESFKVPKERPFEGIPDEVVDLGKKDGKKESLLDKLDEPVFNNISKEKPKELKQIDTETCKVDFDWKTHRIDVLKRIQAKDDIVKETEDDDSLETYDFIVVGGGSAGSTLVANLLKKQPNLRVLLVEAGKPLTDEEICFSYGNEEKNPSKYSCPITLERRKKSGSRKLNSTVACGLGGESLINDMTWIRGDSNDFDDWADVANDQGWNYTSLLPIFKQIESFYPAGDELRGTDGPMRVSFNFTNNPDTKKFRDAIASAGFLINDDHNAKSMYGISYLQTNRVYVKKDGREGLRQDAFSTQLIGFVGTKSLDILTETKAVKIFLDNKNASVKHLVIEHDGKIYRVKAKYDVVLSSGAINSPLILMRSGIGNCDELVKLNIKCKANLKGVGVVHGHLAFNFVLKSTNDTRISDNYVSLNLFDGIIKLKNQNRPKPKFQLKANYRPNDLTLGPEYFSYNVVILHPISRGLVKLKSTNVNDVPSVDTNHISSKDDLNQTIESFKLAIKYGKSLVKLGLKFHSPRDPVNMSDEAIRVWIKKNYYPFANFVGTCKMGTNDDEMAVVDSNLKVFSVNGLRVVDASIMPETTSGNTNCPAMVIGAKGAEILIETYF